MSSPSLAQELPFSPFGLLTVPTLEPAPSRPNLKAVPSVPILGRTEPRLFTPPLRELTPETSYGFAVINFARDVLEEPLDPWEEWLAIHGGELLPDGRPRFRQLLIIVARQNGKTHLLRVLILFWMFVEQWPQILGISKDRQGALKVLETVHEKYILANENLACFMPQGRKDGRNRVVGQEALTTLDGSQYFIGAPNSKAGRGDSLDRVVGDELREHRNWDAYNAAARAMSARPYGQAFFITNQGDDAAIVLHALRKQAADFIETGEGDETLGLFEWSAPGSPDDIDVMDPENWAYANPNLGRRLSVSGMRAWAIAATQSDEQRNDFLTEHLCVRVKVMNPAVSPLAWTGCYVPGSIDLATERVAFCVDISPDQQHATLCAASIQDDKTRVEVLRVWEGINATREMRLALPGIVKQHKPKAFGWFPNGPAAAMAADLKDRTKAGRYGWPIPGVKIEEIKDEVSAVCMGFALLVRDNQVMHDNEAILNDHVTGATKLETGDKWRFSRDPEVGHCDAAYAAAGAVHLARTLPTMVETVLFATGTQ